MTDLNKSNIDEIDLSEVLSILFKSKYQIFIITLIFAISSVFYSLSIPNQYSSSATLTVVQDNNSSNMGSFSRYSELASIAGIKLPSSGEDKSTLVIATINSRSFLKHLLDFEDVLPNIMAAKSFDIKTGNINYEENLYSINDGSWVTNAERDEPSYLDAYKVYKDIVNVSKDDKSNLIYISVTHISPIFAEKFLTLIINEINKLIRDKDFEESEKSLNYLNDQLTEPWQADIKKAINNLIQSQLETQMLTNIRKDYILRTLDPPYVPIEKSLPRRSLICIIITMAGFLISISIVLLRHYVKEKKYYNLKE